MVVLLRFLIYSNYVYYTKRLYNKSNTVKAYTNTTNKRIAYYLYTNSRYLYLKVSSSRPIRTSLQYKVRGYLVLGSPGI